VPYQVWAKRRETVGTEVELKLVTSHSALRKAMALPWLRKMAGDGEASTPDVGLFRYAQVNAA
jgi:hypothetical protein